MSREQLALRLLSSETGINPRPLQTGFMEETDWSKIAKVMNEMASARMWIDDSPTLSVLELRTKTRRLEVEQQGLDLVIVDYLQLMQASTPSRSEPRPGGERDQPRPEEPRQREGAGPRPLPGCRGTWSSGADRGAAPVGPARVRIARAGRGRRHLPVPGGQEPNPDADLELVKAKIAKHRNGPDRRGSAPVPANADHGSTRWRLARRSKSPRTKGSALRGVASSAAGTSGTKEAGLCSPTRPSRAVTAGWTSCSRPASSSSTRRRA